MDDSPQDARKEHERALNRERQRRYQLRKRSNGMVLDDNGRPNVRLTRLMHNKLNGMTDNAALLDAGFSHASTHMLDKVKKPLADLLKAKGLTTAVVVDSTLERVQATSPMLTSEGCIEKPDWAARSAGCRDAIALLDRAGELPAAQAQHGGVQMVVNIIRFGDHTPPDVVNERAVETTFTSDDAKRLDEQGNS